MTSKGARGCSPDPNKVNEDNKQTLETKKPKELNNNSKHIENMHTEDEQQENEKQRELDKKERLIQTYIVIYGLLLVYNQNLSKEAQAASILFFIIYLTTATEYYRAVTLPKKHRKIKQIKMFKPTKIVDQTTHINIQAGASSMSFCGTIVIYAFSTINQLFNDIICSLLVSIALGIPIALTMNKALKIQE